MEIVGFAVGFLGLLGAAFGTFCYFKMRQWESYLRRTRIAIAYKGKSKLNRPLYDWMIWALSIEKDKAARGQEVYRMGSTTVAVLRRYPKDHGKTTVTTRKEENVGRQVKGARA